MQKKFRIIAISGFLALLAMPAFAQTPAPAAPSDAGSTISADEWIQMKKLEGQLRDAKIAKNNVQNVENQAKAYCMALRPQYGKAMLQYNLGDAHTLEWTGDGKCVAFVSYSIGDSGNSTPQIDQEAQVFLNGLLTGSTVNKAGTIELSPGTVAYKKELAANVDSSSSAWWKTILNVIIGGLLNIVNVILALLANVALWVLNYVMDSTMGVNGRPAVIQTGWFIIRDLINMFFILAFIAMALGTILRRTDANRSMIFRLIFMALLVNFSMVFTDVLISISDNLILFFKPDFGGWGKVLTEDYIANGQGLSGFFGVGASLSDGLAGPLITMVGLVLMTIAFLMVAGLMIVRMFGLWVLAMTSPIFFGLRILPATAGYANMWWNNLVKYLIWGPVAMFFFKLAFIFMQAQQNLTEDWVLNKILIAGFIYMGYAFAKASGMQGANFVTSYADRAVKRASATGTAITRGAGTLAWRGNAYGGARGVGSWVKGGLVGEGFKSKTFTDSYSTHKEKFGTATAKIENYPGNLKARFIDKGNKDRTKLVEKEKRKHLIRKNYFKDFDEETARKISGEDVAYMIETGKVNQDKLVNILEHGNKGAKQAIVAAIREGLIHEKTPGLTPQEFEKVFKGARTFAWVDSGRSRSKLDSHPDFMSRDKKVEGEQYKDVPVADRPTHFERDIGYSERNSKFKDMSSKKYAPVDDADPEFKQKLSDFKDRLKNGYLEVGVKHYKDEKEGKKKKGKGSNNDGDQGGSGGSGSVSTSGSGSSGAATVAAAAAAGAAAGAAAAAAVSETLSKDNSDAPPAQGGNS